MTKLTQLRAKVGESDLLLPPVQGWEYRAGGVAKKNKEEERCVEEARRLQPLAAEVDTAVKNGDIVRLKEMQQLETSGNAITTITISSLS